jgi:small subunit ribosomal protein S18
MDHDYSYRERNVDEGADEGGPRGGYRARTPIHIIISDPKLIHYKNVDFLRQFVTERGKMRPRRQTGASAHYQRMIAQAVKRARHLALLPFDREADR